MTELSAVIVMAKQPQAGMTKTRLCPPFSPEDAALLFEALLKDTLALAAGLEGVQLAVAISPPGSAGYFQSITPPGTLLLPVEGYSIGVCLERALRILLGQGFRKVLALNADGPSLPREYLAQAVRLLDGHDLALGPGEDGGYYLIGMKQVYPELFKDIPWSTGQVLQTTLQKAAALGLDVALTPPWYDVDSPTDVVRLQAELVELAQVGITGRLVHTQAFFARRALLGLPE